MRQRKQLIGGTIGNNISIQVDNLAKLDLFPQIDLCKGRVQVGSVHEIQVGAVLVAHSWYGDNMVKDGLQLRNGLGGDAIEGEEDGELLCRAGISQGMGENERSCRPNVS